MSHTFTLSRPGDTARLFEKYYYSVSSFKDGTAEFHSICRRHIARGARILEIGPGPANSTTEYLASLGRVDGVDISPELYGNRYLSTAAVYDGNTVPFETGAFDACVSNYVLEHIDDPPQHFREVARVLKTGGAYCFRSPNLWHYVTLGSKCLPYAVHMRWSNVMRRLGPEAPDPYPTFYAANTARRIKQLCSGAGLTVASLEMVEKEPWYGRRHPILFFPMMAYERVVNSVELFRNARANIFGVAVKCEPSGRQTS
jgi:SAM-dependent methyltransferase